MTAMVAWISSWRRWSRMGAFKAMGDRLHLCRHSRESGNPGRPARLAALDPGFRRDDGRGCMKRAPSRLLPRWVEEHAVAGPAADHAALDLLLLGIPDLDPHLPPRRGESGRHPGEGDVLLQARRPKGGGREAEFLLPRLIGIEEGAGRGLAAL